MGESYHLVCMIRVVTGNQNSISFELIKENIDFVRRKGN